MKVCIEGENMDKGTVKPGHLPAKAMEILLYWAAKAA
jgi:hypothetical protein